MSRNDEPLTRPGILMSAELTWRQHQPRQTAAVAGEGLPSWLPGTCAQCTPTGCPQLQWAEDVRAGREVPYPPVRPKSPVALLLAAARPA